MFRVGLTGGIGSGKSIVSRVFALLGVPVFDADTEAKKIMNENAELKTKLIAAFGSEVYSNNQLNRVFLSTIVFNNPDALQQLNTIVHPIVIAEGYRWMDQQIAPYTIKEAALFFESGSAGGLDFIIGVSAPDHLRIQRVMKRDGISREDVIKRMGQQIPQSLKMKLCDFVISNDEQSLLVPQVLALDAKIRSFIS